MRREAGIDDTATETDQFCLVYADVAVPDMDIDLLGKRLSDACHGLPCEQPFVIVIIEECAARAPRQCREVQLRNASPAAHKEGEIADQKAWWDNQIQKLVRVMGG